MSSSISSRERAIQNFLSSFFRGAGVTLAWDCRCCFGILCHCCWRCGGRKRRSSIYLESSLGEECRFAVAKVPLLLDGVMVLLCSASCGGGDGLRGRENWLRAILDPRRCLGGSGGGGVGGVGGGAVLMLFLPHFKTGRAKLCRGCDFTEVGAGAVGAPLPVIGSNGSKRWSMTK